MLLLSIFLLAACSDDTQEDPSKAEETQNETETKTNDEEENEEEQNNESDQNENDEEQQENNGKIENVTFNDSLEDFKPQGVQPGTYGKYDLSINMSEDLTSQIDAKIEIENRSQDDWDEIKLYFIPESLINGEYGTQFGRDGSVEINSVQVRNQKAEFTSSDNGILTIPLDNKVASGEKAVVNISYSLRPSPEGIRLRRKNGSLFLAQWYPMLPTYQNGEWNIEGYNPRGESYLTTNGSYTLEYQLPKDYYVMTSASDESDEPHQSGKVQGDNLKEMYVGIMDPSIWYVNVFSGNNTDLRMAIKQGEKSQEQKWQKAAKGSFVFFEEQIGDYPLDQLDMIQNSGGMEYAGIIEGSSVRSGPRANATIIHEIAHQWFYYQVNNDPYYNAWVDEGITEFATTLYLMEVKPYEEALQFADRLNSIPGPDKVANLPISEYQQTYGKAVYGQPVKELWRFFEPNGGQDAALEFLSTYYNLYQGKQVTTDEFVRFFRAYVENEPEGYLESWLKLD